MDTFTLRLMCDFPVAWVSRLGSITKRLQTLGKHQILRSIRPSKGILGSDWQNLTRRVSRSYVRDSLGMLCGLAVLFIV